MAEEVAFSFEEAKRIAKKIAEASGQSASIKKDGNQWLIYGAISLADAISPEVYGRALSDCYEETCKTTQQDVKELEKRTAEERALNICYDECNDEID